MLRGSYCFISVWNELNAQRLEWAVSLRSYRRHQTCTCCPSLQLQLVVISIVGWFRHLSRISMWWLWARTWMQPHQHHKIHRRPQRSARWFTGWWPVRVGRQVSWQPPHRKISHSGVSGMRFGALNGSMLCSSPSVSFLCARMMWYSRSNVVLNSMPCCRAVRGPGMGCMSNHRRERSRYCRIWDASPLAMFMRYFMRIHEVGPTGQTSWLLSSHHIYRFGYMIIWCSLVYSISQSAAVIISDLCPSCHPAQVSGILLEGEATAARPAQRYWWHTGGAGRAAGLQVPGWKRQSTPQSLPGLLREAGWAFDPRRVRDSWLRQHDPQVHTSEGRPLWTLGPKEMIWVAHTEIGYFTAYSNYCITASYDLYYMAVIRWYPSDRAPD